jgi:hypothetical protein
MVGQLQSWDSEPSPFGGSNILMKYDHCQIKDAESAYPYSEVTVQVKFSDSLNSGWGKLGQSYATAQSIMLENLDIDVMIGQWHHMKRFEVTFGTDRNTGQAMVGQVWNCVAIVTGTAAPTTTSNFVTTEAVVVEEVKVEPIITTDTLDPVVHTLTLLNGKNLSQFFAAALANDAVKSNPDLVTQIINQTFIGSMVQTGRAVQDADGTYSVPELA